MGTFSKKISTISALAAGLVAFSAAGQAARDESRRRRAQREDREGTGRHD